MWPFNKKIISSPKTNVKSILCIPSFLNDTLEVFNKTNGAYMVVGNILMDVKNKAHYSFEICLPDSRMKKSFEVAGKVTGISEDALSKIDKHTSVIYISSDTGTFQSAYSLAVIGVIFLEIGGIGIKVESAVKAFDKNLWTALVKGNDIPQLYEMFVVGTILDKIGSVYSCGMHNLGYPDVIVLNEEFQDAAKIIRIFNFYQLVDNPQIKDGQTFQTDINSPFYRINEVIEQPNKGVELFENPFGMWSLQRL